MCGRFFWDNDAEEAFEDDFPELIRIARAQEKSLRAGDYMPSMDALAVVGGQAASAVTVRSEAHFRRNSQMGLPRLRQGQAADQCESREREDEVDICGQLCEQEMRSSGSRIL